MGWIRLGSGRQHRSRAGHRHWPWIIDAPFRAEARAGLIGRFGLSQIQADAILEMQLQRLTGLQRQKIVDALKEKGIALGRGHASS